MTNITGKCEKIMLIDDNEIDLYIGSRVLERNNFGKKMFVFSSAITALQYLKDNEENMDALPDIIFLDIYMPLMTGFEFLDAYENLPIKVKEHARIFMVSSTIDQHDMERAEDNKNVVQFHQKPINKAILEGIKC